ncbi:MAG: pilus assembly protein PilM [Burkholderiaceae bacterium]|jgi:type IV pilus assembly protein PilM|nr:MAG: pilus assembly protein PilM [Burkholderiaceae bacterium]
MIESLFKRQPAPLIGLDISASSIKLVELTQDSPAGEFTLERCGVEPLQHGWVSEGNIENFDAVADAAKRLLQKTRTRAKQVALAMPASAVISKKMVLPAVLTEREMEAQVEMEANQYIPFSLDEVSLDFCVIGPTTSSEEDVDVMITASRREKVEGRQGLAEAVGLTPVVMDVDTYAARLALGRLIEPAPALDTRAPVALFEIGGATSNLSVLAGEDLVYEHEQLFGGAQLTQAIAHQYGFTEDEAESKKRAGDLPADYADAVLAPFVESLAQEIERALKFFFTSTPHNKVERILLAGGSAGLIGLAEAVDEHTSFPCEVVDPFAGMQYGRAVNRDRLTRTASTYLTACGLAMRRFLR